jgi:hypothetical protein
LLRVLWWTSDGVAVTAAVFGTLLLRFPDEQSTPWAAAAAVVLIKGLKAAIVGLFVAVDKAFTRAFKRMKQAAPHSNRRLVPVAVRSRPDIQEHRPYQPRHAEE